MILAALLLQAAAPTVPAPSGEALDLGKRVAASGMLARMIPQIGDKEAGEIIAEHPELTATDQAQLRQMAVSKAVEGRDKLVEAMGTAYARQLSIDDLKAIAAFNESSAAQRLKEVEPEAIQAAVSVMSGFDYKGTVLKDFCARTGKACPAKK